MWWIWSRDFRYWASRGIPGPTPIPIFVPHLHLEVNWYSKYGKMYGYYRGHRPVLTVAEPELIKSILIRDFNSFTDRNVGQPIDPTMASNIGQACGDEWRRLRHIISPAFTTGRMKRMYPSIRQCIRDLQTHLDACAQDRRPLNVMEMFGNFTMDVVATCAYFIGNVPILSISDLSLVKRILITDFHVFSERSTRITVTCAFVMKAIWGRVQYDKSRILLSPGHTGAKFRQIYTHLSAMVDNESVPSESSYDSASIDKPRSVAVVDVARLLQAFSCNVYPACGLSIDVRPYDEPENRLSAHLCRFLQIDIRKNLVSVGLPEFATNWPTIGDYRVMTNLIDVFRKYIPERRRGGVLGESGYKCFIFSELALLDPAPSIGIPVYTSTELLAMAFAFSTAGIAGTACTLTACIFELILNLRCAYIVIRATLTVTNSDYYNIMWPQMAPVCRVVLNPATQRRLYSEIVGPNNDGSYEACERLPYLDAVVSETLRLHSPIVPLLRAILALPYQRVNTSRSRFTPYTIQVEYYSEPYKFNPDRFMPENAPTLVPYAYLPFGAGRRSCIGTRFGLFVIKRVFVSPDRTLPLP
ncbi:unnamed protein product [Oppiella nova]|uniref:Cytochrome P450 n=1 Tax=Oppiella nova TaxID=334625 RepID=A0A7R9M5F5_9ACAR|nr:unnamed protein product [Oppiella nova]CAG2171110.1 unnamed protein product [Oppiella nova]